ncbi:MAG: hypothetical protein AAFU71_18715 [Cyanobacteria bacterium J06632_22]
MEKLQAQASKLWQLLFDPETAATYQKTLSLTGVILKETALLLWLFFCSIFVLGAWLGKTGLAWGRDTRTWIDSQSQSEADSGATAAATGQAILDAGQSGAYFLLDKAYEQLGLDKPERPAKPVATAPAAQPKVAKPASKVSSAEPAATPAKAKSTPVAEAKAADDVAVDKEETSAVS